MTEVAKNLKIADFDQWREQWPARREKLKAEYCREYGFETLSDEELTALGRARRKLEECDGCNGRFCNKIYEKLRRPQISSQDGRLKIETIMCDVWHREMFGKNCLRAGLPPKYAAKTFADYDTTPDNDRAVKMAQWFLDGERKKWLYFYGMTGTGKTFLASLIAREYILQGKSVVLGDVPMLLRELKNAFDSPNQSSSAILNRYLNCTLLVLDDIGAGQITEWNVGIVYQIINARYNASKSTILTSNFDLDGLERKLLRADDIAGKRIVSRLSEMCVLGFLGTKDRRLNK